jgi:hypothetical protein
VKDYKFTIARVFIGEMLLASLIYILCVLTWSSDNVVWFTIETAERARVLFGTLLAAPLTLLVLLFHWSGEKFGEFLHRTHANRVLYAVFITAFLVFLSATVLSIAVIAVPRPVLAKVTAWFSLLAVLNAITMVKNIVELNFLRMDFKKLVLEEDGEEKKP